MSFSNASKLPTLICNTFAIAIYLNLYYVPLKMEMDKYFPPCVCTNTDYIHII